MNAALRTNLVRAALLASGAAAGAGGSFALTPAAREPLAIALGDTVSIRFSIKTDSVLAAVGNSNVVGRRCGASAIYLRVWRGPVQRFADTLPATVPCAPAPTLAYVDTVYSVCMRPSPDSMAKYAVNAETTVAPALVPCLIAEGTRDSAPVPRQAHPVAYKRLTPHYLVK